MTIRECSERPYRARRIIRFLSPNPRTVALNWRAIAPDALGKRLANTNQQIHDPIGARVLADGTRWFTLSGFDGDPDSAAATALTPLIAAMLAARAATAAAPRSLLARPSNNGGAIVGSRRIYEPYGGRQR